MRDIGLSLPSVYSVHYYRHYMYQHIQHIRQANKSLISFAALERLLRYSSSLVTTTPPGFHCYLYRLSTDPWDIRISSVTTSTVRTAPSLLPTIIMDFQPIRFTRSLRDAILRYLPTANNTTA